MAVSATETISINEDSKPSAEIIEGILTGDRTLTTEYRVRKRSYNEISVSHLETEKYLEGGWEIIRNNKRSARLRKAKAHDQSLEDRVWCLMYKMQYPYIGNHNCQVQFRRENGSVGKKQIDILAFDCETAFVVECKSRSTKGRRALQKGIHETAYLMDFVRKSIFDYFDGKYKPKLVWVYATNNIIWSDPDVDRAEASGIEIVTENELQYYEAFLKHMGLAGRYQLLGHFLEGKKVPGMEQVTVPAIRGKVGGEAFYSFVATPRQLLKISFVNHQALNNPDGRPAYQRMVNGNRIKEIAGFIQEGGYFPTNILLNFTSKPRFSQLPNSQNTDPNIKFGWLTLPQKYCSAWVIDGQHRLYGFSKLDDAYLDHSLFVVAFESMDTYKEADLFITINHKQKSVPRGLLVSLLSDLKITSDDPRTRLNALASASVRSINNDKSNPFFMRFAQPDVPADATQPLTISEAVKGLTVSQLIGKAIRRHIVPGPLHGQTDDETISRVRKVVGGYFERIRTAHPVRWEEGKAAYICVNPGVRAHLLFLAEAIRYLSARDSIDVQLMSPEEIVARVSELEVPIESYISSAAPEEIKSRFGRKFGEGGVREYFYNLCELVAQDYPDFGPKEFREFVAQRDDQRADWADKLIINLNSDIINHVIDVLKRVYGTHRMPSGDPAFWELGIKSVGAKEKAYKRQQQDPPGEKRLPKEAYLEILDLKEIVEQKDNWEHFRPVFNIPMETEKKGKKFYTQWMVEFNELRRIPAHKSKFRTYTDEHFEFLSWLEGEFYTRMEGGVA